MKDQGKTKDQLIQELAEMRRRITELEKSETEGKRAECALGERVKELECLYGIAGIAETAGITLAELYEEVVGLLPVAWQYPEITCARISIGDRSSRQKIGQTPSGSNLRISKCMKQKQVSWRSVT